MIASFSVVIIIGLSFVSEYICKKYCPYSNGTQEYNSVFSIFCSFARFIGAHIEVFSIALTATATGVMAYFTGRLEDTTNKLWQEAKVSSDSTKIAADAASKSADVSEKAFLDLEGPFLYPVIDIGQLVGFISTGSFYQNTFQQTKLPPIGIRIKNFGRSPALPGTISCVFFRGEADDRHSDSQTGYYFGPVLGPKATSKGAIEREFNQTLNGQECKAIQDGTATLYLTGSINYLDMSGNEFIQTFCLKWIYTTHDFVAWGPTRNERKRKSAQKRQ